MANLVDIFTQTNSTNKEIQLLTTIEDLPKDKPSLFDSLLKTTIDNLQISKEPLDNKTALISKDTQETTSNNKLELDALETQNIDNVDTLSSSEELVTSDTNKEKIPTELKDKDSINKQPIKNNSLLDRLILEVKSNNLDSKLEKVEEDLNKIPKQPLDMQDKLQVDMDTLNSLEKGINSGLEAPKSEQVIDKSLEVSQDGKVVETIKIENIEVEDNITKSVIEIKTSQLIIDGISKEEVQDIQNKDISKEGIQTIQNIGEVDALSNLIDTSKSVKEQDLQVPKAVLDLDSNQQNSGQKLSLMDQLIKSNSAQKDIVEVKNINQDLQQEVTSSLDKSVEAKSSKEIASNIFLADQKNVVNNQLLFNKNEAIKILENASSLEDIQKSAQILDLEATQVEVEQDIVKEDLKHTVLNDKESIDRKNILHSILNEKDIRSVDIKNLITNSIEASKALLEDNLTIQEDRFVDIQPSLANSIQTRIIGAKQHLSTMMSDIARQMYENYKPPVTVFRINLNPVDLGSISVLMKQDKSSGLNISMSISSLATLELLMDNQNMLRNSLVKTFSDNSSFSLDFSSGENSSSKDSSSNSQNRGNRNNSNTEAILKLKEENRDFEEKTDYM